MRVGVRALRYRTMVGSSPLSPWVKHDPHLCKCLQGKGLCLHLGALLPSPSTGEGWDEGTLAAEARPAALTLTLSRRESAHRRCRKTVTRTQLLLKHSTIL